MPGLCETCSRRPEPPASERVGLDPQVLFGSYAGLLLRLLASGFSQSELQVTGCWSGLQRLHRHAPDLFPAPEELFLQMLTADAGPGGPSTPCKGSGGRMDHTVPRWG